MRRWICSWRSDKRQQAGSCAARHRRRPAAPGFLWLPKPAEKTPREPGRGRASSSAATFFPTVARTVSGRVAPCIHLRPRAGFFCSELCKPLGVLASFFLAGRVG